MKLRTAFPLFILFLSLHSFGQPDYHSPLGIPLILSSNFGELRPNHFHMGLDFKTNMKIGYRIYSIEEGYVSRVKVSPYGYGKVVYVDHPNGITSVYAHCSEFKGAIDSLVSATQKAEENFAIDVYPAKNQIKVKKGEVIAISGNTGGSTAPHLHFELRDTETEHALNPLLYGFDIADSKAPEIRGLKVYGLNKDGYRYDGKEIFKTVVKGSNGYYIGADQIIVPASYCSEKGGIGFAFDVIDRFDGAINKCGLFGSTLIVNGDTLFGQETSRVPFESSRYVNSHKDYEAYQMLKKKFHKCFKTTENDLLIYDKGTKLGILKAKPGDVFAVKYIAYDVKGNSSNISFEVVIQQGEINKETLDPGDGILHPQTTFHYETAELEIECGLATVYEPEQIDMANIDHSFIDPDAPVNRTYNIKLKKPANFAGKHYLEMQTAKGRKKAITVTEHGDWLVAQCKYFGEYQLVEDITAPSVFPVNFRQSTTIISTNTLTWRITERDSGIADYDLYIDGEWYVLEYETKGSLLIFNRPENLAGTKELVLRATDNCGNTSEWKKDVTFR